MIDQSFNPWKHFDSYHEKMFDDKSSEDALRYFAPLRKLGQ